MQHGIMLAHSIFIDYFISHPGIPEDLDMDVSVQSAGFIAAVFVLRKCVIENESHAPVYLLSHFYLQ